MGWVNKNVWIDEPEDLKERVKESIERKIRLKDITYNSASGSLEPLSLFNTIRRMKIIERLFNGKELG
jgi:hypothetical protein